MIPLDPITTHQITDFDLGDVRLNKRATLCFRRMDEMGPAHSFPGIFRDQKELKGFYRLVNNPNVKASRIFAGYHQGLVSLVNEAEPLMEQEQLYLFQDTTFGKYHNRKIELGYLETGSDNGVVLHNGVLTDGNFIPIGIPVQDFIIRQRSEYGKRHKRKERPFEQKESYKWVSTFQWAQKYEAQTGKRIIQVADREADIAELFNFALAHKQYFIIRAQWDRRLEGQEADHLFSFMRRQAAQGKIKVTLLDEKGKGHEVECAITYACVKLDTVIAPLQAIFLQQLQAYEGQQECSSYMLLTNLAVDSAQQAEDIHRVYTHRWRTCEDFHKCLKTGCAIEQRQFDNVHALQNALAMLSLMAIRLLRMRHMAQIQSQAPIKDVLHEAEMQLAYHLADKYMKPIDLTFCQVGTTLWWILLLGRIGGHQGFKQKGMPGWQTLWRGWLYFQTLMEGINLSKNLGPT